MAVVKWSFRSTDFETNPESVEGWEKEEKTSEIDLLDSDTTVIQISGFKSGVMDMEGWILSAAFLAIFEGWRGLTGTLTDDLGNSWTARLMEFVPRRVTNVADWNTYKYRARWIKR